MNIEKIYIDLDGCIVDMDSALRSIPGLTDENFWEHVKKIPHFYLGLKPMPEADILMEYLRGLDVPLAILTALPRRSSIPDAEADKRAWVKHWVGDIEFNIGPYAKDKQRFAGPGRVLIDDSELNIPQWRSRGGFGILYTDFLTCYDQLERYRRSDE